MILLIRRGRLVPSEPNFPDGFRINTFELVERMVFSGIISGMVAVSFVCAYFEEVVVVFVCCRDGLFELEVEVELVVVVAVVVVSFVSFVLVMSVEELLLLAELDFVERVVTSSGGTSSENKP